MLNLRKLNENSLEFNNDEENTNFHWKRKKKYFLKIIVDVDTNDLCV